MNEVDKIKIRAECNFLQDLLYNLYIGKEEFTVVNWRSICTRLQSIRDVVKE